MRKKIILLIITFIAGYNSSFAQSKLIDSLQKVLQAHPQNDTIKVDMLYDLGREFRRSKPKQADSAIELAFTLSNQLNYKKGKGKALTLKAVRYYDLSNYPSAYKSFDQAEQLVICIIFWANMKKQFLTRKMP